MKTTPLFAALALGISATGCVTKTYYVETVRPTPTPAPRIIYREAAPRKAPANAPQNDPASFEAVTRPQSYSN